MYDTRVAIASVTLDSSCMPTDPSATNLFLSVGGGRGAIACPTLGLQLQVSPSVAILHAYTTDCN